MECIKTEPTIALEDSLMHVFQLKPDPDIFFQHFLDSELMVNIQNIFVVCLRNLTEFYCKFIKFVLRYNGKDDILSVLSSPIICYRMWYESVLEKFPGNYKPPQAYGFYATSLTDDLTEAYEKIKFSLLNLNKKVKDFDVAWKKNLVMDYRCLDSSLRGAIASLDGFIYNNRIGRDEVDRLPAEITINGIQQVDPVTNSIKNIFPEVYIALFNRGDQHIISEFLQQSIKPDPSQTNLQIDTIGEHEFYVTYKTPSGDLDTYEENKNVFEGKLYEAIRGLIFNRFNFLSYLKRYSICTFLCFTIHLSFVYG